MGWVCHHHLTISELWWMFWHEFACTNGKKEYFSTLKTKKALKVRYYYGVVISCAAKFRFASREVFGQFFTRYSYHFLCGLLPFPYRLADRFVICQNTKINVAKWFLSLSISIFQEQKWVCLQKCHPFFSQLSYFNMWQVWQDA